MGHLPPPSGLGFHVDLGGHTASSQVRTLVLAPKFAYVQGSMRKIPFILEIYSHHVRRLIWTPQSWVSPGPAPNFCPNNTTHHKLSTAASYGPHLCALTWFSSYAGSLTLRVSQADQPGGSQSLQCCQQLFPPRSPPLAVSSSALPAVGELW